MKTGLATTVFELPKLSAMASEKLSHIADSGVNSSQI